MNKKIKLKRPYRIILDYGITELELAGDSHFCSIVEETTMVVKDDKVYENLKAKNLIAKELDK